MIDWTTWLTLLPLLLGVAALAWSLSLVRETIGRVDSYRAPIFNVFFAGLRGAAQDGVRT